VRYSQGGQPSLVLASADDGRTWTVADQDLDETDDFTVPAGPDVVADLAGIAVSTPGTAVMAGLVPGTAAVMNGQGGDTWGVVTSASSPPAPAAAPVRLRPRVPGVPASDGADSTYVIHGISFWGRTGWLYLDDSGTGAAGNGADRTLVYRTENGGRTWSLIEQSTS
jgi:hypothetical protein